MDEWHEAESKHMVCTGVLVLQLKAFFLSGLFDRQVNRFKNQMQRLSRKVLSYLNRETFLNV